MSRTCGLPGSATARPSAPSDSTMNRPSTVKMSTEVSGTFEVRTLVASSPSIPGMRTSMITTLGFRRSASDTAEAPSDASPTTRMCGARESESRSPSRTTS
jgi:hypothetical protein